MKPEELARHDGTGLADLVRRSQQNFALSYTI